MLKCHTTLYSLATHILRSHNIFMHNTYSHNREKKIQTNKQMRNKRIYYVQNIGHNPGFSLKISFQVLAIDKESIFLSSD